MSKQSMPLPYGGRNDHTTETILLTKNNTGI